MQEIELHKLYKRNITLTEESIENSTKNRNRTKAIESINNRCFQGIMSPSWSDDIDLWFKNYKFDPEVMVALFEHCLSKSALHRNYVRTVAEAWHNNNIMTYSDLENYYQKYEKTTKIKSAIVKKLGRYNPLSEFESAYVDKWVLDFGYDINIINLALKKTTSKINPTFDYFDKIISNWNERNLKTVADIEKFSEEFKQKNKNVKELKKNAFNLYEQRTYEDVDTLYDNIQKSKQIG